MGFRIGQTERRVVMGYRSGGVVGFDVSRRQSFTGSLVSGSAVERAPIEFAKVKVLDQVSPDSVTGQGGEFYLENLEIGQTVLSVDDGSTVYRCAFEVPVTDATLVRIGEVRCDATR